MGPSLRDLSEMRPRDAAPGSFGMAKIVCFPSRLVWIKPAMRGHAALVSLVVEDVTVQYIIDEGA
jgi:hypothetical protein